MVNEADWAALRKLTLWFEGAADMQAEQHQAKVMRTKVHELNRLVKRLYNGRHCEQKPVK